MNWKKAFVALFSLMTILSGFLNGQLKLKSTKPGVTYVYDGTIEIKASPVITNKGGPQPISLETTTYPSRQMGDLEVYPVKQTLNNVSMFIFLAEDENGAYIFATQGPSDAEPVIAKDKCYTLKYPPEVGMTWEYKNNKGESYISKIENRETITVVSGNYECIKISQFGSRYFENQLAPFKSLEWIDVKGSSVKSYSEYQIKDWVIGQPAKVIIGFQLSSIIEERKGE